MIVNACEPKNTDTHINTIRVFKRLDINMSILVVTHDFLTLVISCQQYNHEVKKVASDQLLTIRIIGIGAKTQLLLLSKLITSNMLIAEHNGGMFCSWPVYCVHIVC